MIPAARFWVAFFLILFDTACRFSAAWALRWTDYRPDVPSLLFRAESQKNRCDQLLRISHQTANALQAILDPPRVLIFPWELHWTSRYNHIKRIFRAAGLPADRRGLCQKIRRTSLTLIHRAGGDACQQGGHSSPAVTVRYYLDPTTGVQGVDFLPRLRLSVNRQRTLF